MNVLREAERLLSVMTRGEKAQSTATPEPEEEIGHTDTWEDFHREEDESVRGIHCLC